MVKTREKVASSASKTVEFFKVYLPQFSSRRLVLPPAFIDILDEPVPHEATLRDQMGRSWPVTVEKERNGCVLMADGWRNFAIHHSLEFGDFLIFDYNGNSSFFVSIFGRNGLRKDSCVATDSFSSPAKEKPDNVPNKSIPKGRDSLTRKAKKCRVIGSSQVEPCEINQVPVMQCKDEKEEPKNPHFVKRITPYLRYRMDIPKSFLKVHKIKLEKTVELTDPKGKKWPVKINSMAKGTYMSSGWGNFRRIHRLGKKNKCLFKFILGRGIRKCKDIHVQIIDSDLKTQTKNRYQIIDI